MIAIGTNFLYTRTFWFFDKGNPKERHGRVLMIDARSIHRNSEHADVTEEYQSAAKELHSFADAGELG